MQRRSGPRPDAPAALQADPVDYALVALGSAIGGTLRALVSLAIPAGAGFTWATLVVNVVGSFAIALYVTLAEPEGRLKASPKQRCFVTTGLLGGFTTFSIFSVETLRFLQVGAPGMAALVMALSVAAWLGAAWLGQFLGRRVNRLAGR